jgi:hypothetical protein
MKFHLHELGLDEEVTARDYRASLTFGRVYLHDAEYAISPHDRTDLLVASASSFRRAGASAMLLGLREEMTQAFREASRVYAQVGLPYAVVMSVLAGDAPQSPSDAWPQQASEWEPDLIYYLLLRASDRSQQIDWLFHRMTANAQETVGVFELPISMYLALARALQNGEVRDVRETLRPFLLAYDQAVHLAHYRHAWRLLVQRMHPAEPDILFPLTLVRLAQGYPRFSDALREPDIDPFSRTLLLGCLATRFGDELE